jgi:DNA-binding response OmpR family regulator
MANSELGGVRGFEPRGSADAGREGSGRDWRTGVCLIGGRSSDARWLTRLGAAGGHTFVVAELPASGFGANDGPEAFVLEVAESPALTGDALRVIRAEPHFRRALAFASLNAEQVSRGDAVQLGFDDFVVRPYGEAELHERVRLIRSARIPRQERLRFPGFEIDLFGHSVRAQGQHVPLTVREFALIAEFSRRAGQMLSRQELLRRVWGRTYDGGPRTVDIHVRRLRQKLKDSAPIKTVRGAGYRLDAAPLEPTSPPDGLSSVV